ncbi:hypothetical protein D623_10020847 [Myotis brandtii]|uniref:Uncharacterized protein n=1 Tax=Myotis brandtii TaxID=109478 RepID=S7MVA3_MYOBR|nr:hypothetical protein D623_10020847 [Myotis brandtii]
MATPRTRALARDLLQLLSQKGPLPRGPLVLGKAAGRLVLPDGHGDRESSEGAQGSSVLWASQKRQQR